MTAQDPMDYREVTRILRAEGHDIEDIDAVIDSLISAGIEHADEDHLYLTSAELDVLRAQLVGGNDEAATIDRILSAGQAASILGVTRRTILNWANDGRFPNAWTTPGGHLRIPDSEVRALRGR